MSGFPQPAFSAKTEAAELARYVGPEAIADYEKCEDKVACRNTIIDARLRMVDLAFYRFVRRTFRQESGVALGSDVLVLGLEAAATASGARALSAGASVLTGGRDAYQKQVMSVSLPLLFEEMQANRREVLLRIRQAEAMPVSAYSLFQALADISEYELAGSIPNAAAELSATAGASARMAQARLDEMRKARFAAAGAVPASTSTPEAASPPGESGGASPPTAAAPAPAVSVSSPLPSAGSPSPSTPRS